jgi:8-oxo-dGTP diphosphatase
MAAGALFRDEIGRVLLVEPTYKPNWEIPGGAVERDESPTAACRREVIEELGLDRSIGRVLAVDWVPSRPERPEGLILIYDGGVLTEDVIAAIRLDPDELASYAFVEADQVGERASELLTRRLTACLDAVSAGTTLSLENGSPTG